MLQRSPTYVISMPGEDPVAQALRRFLPDRVVYPIVRWKNVTLQSLTYRLARTRPRLVKKMVRRGLLQALPAGFDIYTHFKPKYNPWDQRLCLVPDADLFRVLSDGSADIVTDRIAGFDETGIELESGERLDADVVITATGLNLLFLGGMKLTIDGEELDPGKAIAYKGMMLGGVPNLIFTIGYTNASWTLKADLVAEYACRLINKMATEGQEIAVPRLEDPTVTPEPLLDFNSGYVLRSIEQLPKQGSKEPWKLRQNYPVDLRSLRYGEIEDGALVLSRLVAKPEPVAA
jgi:cation diffusion facilitator CzcD-associated flavoprotein CzcO